MENNSRSKQESKQHNINYLQEGTANIRLSPLVHPELNFFDFSGIFFVNCKNLIIFALQIEKNGALAHLARAYDWQS